MRILLKNFYNSFMHFFLLLNICTMRDKQIRKSMSIKKQHGLHSVLNYSCPVILLKVSLGANVQFEMFHVTPCFFDSFLNPSDMPFSTSKIHFKIGLLSIWGHVYFNRRVSLKFYKIQKTTCWRINISKSQHTERYLESKPFAVVLIHRKRELRF